MIQRISVFVVALGCCSVAASARADGAPPSPSASGASAPDAGAEARQEAARRFEHAIKLYEEGDYALALAEFERVHDLIPDYRVLYNIGQVSIQLGRYARAYRTLREYLQRGGAELGSDRVAAVQADLDLLAARTAQVQVRVDHPGAEISVDGVMVGVSPLPEPLVVDVGERRVHVRLDGYRPQTKTLSLAGGDRRESDFVLELVQQEAPPAAAAVAAPPPPEDRGQHGESSRSPWLWVGWASTGALAAGAVVTGVLGVSAASDLADLRDSAGTERSELDAAEARARNLFLTADILAAAALVTGGVTLYFQVSSPSRANGNASPQPAVGLNLSPNRVSLTLRH